MDGIEAMPLSGETSYNWQRGLSVPLSVAQATATMHASTAFRPLPNPSIPIQPNMRRGGAASSSLPMGSSHLDFPSISNAVIASSPSEQNKRKRGRPRKYIHGGTVSLALSPISAPLPRISPLSPLPRRGRGRPPGTGRKQQLAAFGEWMVESSGQAFAPHIISVAVGEVTSHEHHHERFLFLFLQDVAAKIQSISQQRPRTVCVLSGNGMVSSVTLKQPTSCDGSITFEGRFEILCLSGSFLVDESGGPRSRIGGVNVSLCSSDGRVIGGVAGILIAATPVQVVMCSFLYGGSKVKNKKIVRLKGDESVAPPDVPGSASEPLRHHQDMLMEEHNPLDSEASMKYDRHFR